MRGLFLLVDVAVVTMVVYVIYRVVTGLGRRPQRGGRPVDDGQRPPVVAGGRWQARHYAEDGHTVVAVTRATPGGAVIEEHVVARIHDADEDWSRKFLLARQEAEERAFHLNADTD